MNDQAHRRGAFSPEAKALVDLARDGDSPSAEDRARIRRAVAAGVAASVAGSSASAAAASKSVLGAAAGSSAVAAKGSVGLWLVGGVLAGLAGAAALFTLVPADHSPGGSAPERVAASAAVPHAASDPSPPAPEETAAPFAVAVPGAASPAASPAPPAIVATGATSPVVPSPMAPRGSALARAEPGAATARDAPAEGASVRAFSEPQGSTLGAETALLEGARRALGQGDSAGALALLARHEREFPKGALVEERLAAKVFALCGLGRRAEAARTAARLLEASPNSPLRARVLDSCAYRP